MAKRGPASPSPAKGSHTMTGHPLAKRGAPHGPPYRPIGSPLGRRNFGHWPHTAGSLSLVKRGAPLTAPPGRRPFAYWPHTPPPPPLAREADGPHREKGSHALTGLPLATYWPPTGPLLAIRGGLPLAKGEAPTGQWDGRGSLWPHGSSSPPTSRPPMAKGEPPPYWPPTGPPLATKGRGGGAFARPSPD